MASTAGPENQPYTTVVFGDSVQYTLRVYPSQEIMDEYLTHQPLVYMFCFVATFLFASLLFVWFSHVVEKRQVVMMDKVLDNAKRAATAERELNEFLSHEVRSKSTSFSI